MNVDGYLQNLVWSGTGHVIFERCPHMKNDLIEVVNEYEESPDLFKQVVYDDLYNFVPLTPGMTSAKVQPNDLIIEKEKAYT